jgi:hypothetical protein
LRSVTFLPENRAFYEIMWKNKPESDRTQITTWRMRFACWIPKDTNTHSEYVILIAFPGQQMLRERASMLRYMYIGCVVSSFRGPFSAGKYTEWVQAQCCIALGHRQCFSQASWQNWSTDYKSDGAGEGDNDFRDLPQSLQARPTYHFYRGTTSYQQVYHHTPINFYHHHTLIIHQSYYHRRHTVSPSLADYQNDFNYFTNNGRLECRRVVW